jgi:hypothetical protein
MIDRLAKLENRLQQVSKGSNSVVVAPKSNKAKRRRNRNRDTTSTLKSERRVTGRDLIATFTVDAKKLTTGAGLAQIAVSPRSFAKSRLASESALWNQWRPKNLKITLRSTIPLLGNGLSVVAWSAQPNEVIGKPTLATTRLLTMRPSQMTAMGTVNTISIPCNNLRLPWFLCQGHNDLTDHGTILVCVGGAATNVTGNVSFTLELDYDIEFKSPDITPSAELETIYVDEGWYPYFTTSDGSFADAKKLTLKRHEGGDPCQFSDAVPGAVYELGKGASLNYIKPDGSKGNIKYMVRIKDSALPHVAVFDDQTKAANYARTGDLANCIDYKNQGDWVTPDDPYWNQISQPEFFMFRLGYPTQGNRHFNQDDDLGFHELRL